MKNPPPTTTNDDTPNTEFLFRLFTRSALCDTSTISIDRAHRAAEYENRALRSAVRAMISISLRLKVLTPVNSKPPDIIIISISIR
jgi:hypothetical protein